MARSIFIILVFGLLLFPFISKADVVVSDGDLIRAQDSVDVYIVKIIPSIDSGQVKKFKRLILNPEIFNQYSHLTWDIIKDIDKFTINQFTTSDLARTVNDDKIYKLYPNGDTGEKRWIKTADDFLDLGYDWDSVYEINSYERDYYILGDDLVALKPPSDENNSGEQKEPEDPVRDATTINVPEDYTTIQEAVDSAIDGDTISVSAGIYNENIVLNKNLNLIGSYAESVIINGHIDINENSDFLIQRFTFKNTGDKTIYCSSGSKGKIKNVILKDSLYGLYIDGNCEIDILNSLIFDNEGNEQGAGIFIKDNDYFVQIINNTIDSNYTGIWSENSDVKIMNNIITNNLGGGNSYGIYHSGTGKADCSYNNVYQNGINYYGAEVGNGSLIVDPRFIDSINENYALKTSATTSEESFCLDKGNPDYIYNDAILKGNLYRNDMGAYGGPDNIGWTP